MSLRALRSQRGQMMVLTTLMITGLLGLSAFVLDVGAWFREQRRTQQVADAAALAGAQVIAPQGQSAAQSLALQFANSKNGGTMSSGDITFPQSWQISVVDHGSSPSFFAKVLGFGSVNVSASASAQAFVMSAAIGSSPFAINKNQPEILCGVTCWNSNYPTTLDLQKVGPGGFKIINVDGSYGGTGQSTLADWITNGYGGKMDLGDYYSDAGAKFNAQEVQSALDGRQNTDLLFPVYDSVFNGGSNLEYHVVGWAVFHLTGYSIQGNSGTLSGYFDTVNWNGVPSPGGGNYFGAVTVKLVS